MKYSALLTAIILLSGCYPIYKTLQPSAMVTVKDDDGKPVSVAAVTLSSSAYPYGLEKSRYTEVTRASGEAEFPSIREWRTELVMIHGAEVYFWNWCVVKDGYETILTHNSNSDQFEEKPIFILKKGASTPCPPFRR